VLPSHNTSRNEKYTHSPRSRPQAKANQIPNSKLKEAQLASPGNDTNKNNSNKKGGLDKDAAKGKR
jgi:hypothetical protein